MEHGYAKEPWASVHTCVSMYACMDKQLCLLGQVCVHCTDSRVTHRSTGGCFHMSMYSGGHASVPECELVFWHTPADQEACTQRMSMHTLEAV